MNTVEMYGPAFDDSGKLVNRDVPEADVAVYEAAGYKRGRVEVEAEPEVVEEKKKPRKK